MHRYTAALALAASLADTGCSNGGALIDQNNAQLLVTADMLVNTQEVIFATGSKWVPSKELRLGYTPGLLPVMGELTQLPNTLYVHVPYPIVDTTFAVGTGYGLGWIDGVYHTGKGRWVRFSGGWELTFTCDDGYPLSGVLDFSGDL